MKALVSGTTGFHCIARSPYVAAQMQMLPFRAGDVPDTEADISELIAAVDDRPAVWVEEALVDFVEWHPSYHEC
ncbi:MAG: hypothetical protein M3R16_06445 [Pseudomonadota bacterium]|nr:hypothetical protein [Pseudomonadota bacterium]